MRQRKLRRQKSESDMSAMKNGGHTDNRHACTHGVAVSLISRSNSAVSNSRSRNRLSSPSLRGTELDIISLPRLAEGQRQKSKEKEKKEVKQKQKQKQKQTRKQNQKQE